ncbi:MULTISPECIES: response regulator transcription factor [Filomicrobium]|nr:MULTISPECIES: response regulator transcription factor [Filomicrobium]MCV0367828.1 response regulator transcription factor [Filomicrobium sp.]
MSAYSFIIVDDHPLFRGALRESLSAAFNCTIDEAGSLDELNMRLMPNRAIDLILLDLSMPGVQGLSGLLFLRAQFPEIPVVVCSASEEPTTIRRCIEFGASGFIPKSHSAEAIRKAIGQVLGGEIYMPSGTDLSVGADDDTSELSARLSTLTPQQVRVLMMLGEGLLNKQIAYKLSVSEATIKAHVSAILQKLGVDSRTQAVIAINKIDDGWRQPATR